MLTLTHLLELYGW